MAWELAERIVHMPKTFAAGNKSTACLLREAGFPQARKDLSVAEVEQVLEREPELADLWLERGHDQRAAQGWGIEGSSGDYQLVHFADGHREQEKNRLHATAEFVVRYVGFIGDVMRRWQH